jgi:predicted NUDIX family phosphoesterase
MDKNMDERILCFKTQLLEDLGRFQGISFNIDKYFPAIITPPNCYYIPRKEAEADPRKKQVIPYVLLVHGDQIFSYRRGKRGGEERLHEEYSVGIGGHIEATDLNLFSQDPVGYADGVLREVFEEVKLNCGYKESCVALINDDRNEVGRVHFGIVHVWELADRSVEKNDSSITDAGLIPIQKALCDVSRYETWSQLCLDNIGRLLRCLSYEK